MSTLSSNDVQAPENPPVTPLNQEPPKKPSNRHKTLIIVLSVVVAIFLAVLAGLYFFMKNDQAKPASDTPVVSDKKDTDKDKPAKGIACSDSYRVFADSTVGMTFCYPNEWGDATVHDAKVGPADTGHRESIRFASMPLFSVGGTSDDWSTTVGRDVGCLEPNNQPVPLGEYDTAWHGIIGSGADVEYAMRSLPSPTGGYDSTETVSNILQSGVCTQAHKVINGSRYRVAFAGFYRDFAEASGITTPSAHIAEPNVLFSVEQRAQFDTLLASLSAY